MTPAVCRASPRPPRFQTASLGAGVRAQCSAMQCVCMCARAREREIERGPLIRSDLDDARWQGRGRDSVVVQQVCQSGPVLPVGGERLSWSTAAAAGRAGRRQQSALSQSQSPRPAASVAVQHFHVIELATGGCGAEACIHLHFLDRLSPFRTTLISTTIDLSSHLDSLISSTRLTFYSNLKDDGWRSCILLSSVTAHRLRDAPHPRSTRAKGRSEKARRPKHASLSPSQTSMWRFTFHHAVAQGGIHTKNRPVSPFSTLLLLSISGKGMISEGSRQGKSGSGCRPAFIIDHITSASRCPRWKRRVFVSVSVVICHPLDGRDVFLLDRIRAGFDSLCRPCEPWKPLYR